MEKIKRFIMSLRVFLALTRAGFYFSHSTTALDKKWGFYRFNHDDGKRLPTYSIFDVDFDESRYYHVFYHIHGGVDCDKTMFRMDYKKG